MCETVGELIEALSRYPPETKFARHTNGHYQCYKLARVTVLSERRELTEVMPIDSQGFYKENSGHVRSVPSTKQLRVSVGTY